MYENTRSNTNTETRTKKKRNSMEEHAHDLFYSSILVWKNKNKQKKERNHRVWRVFIFHSYKEECYGIYPICFRKHIRYKLIQIKTHRPNAIHIEYATIFLSEPAESFHQKSENIKKTILQFRLLGERFSQIKSIFLIIFGERFFFSSFFNSANNGHCKFPKRFLFVTTEKRLKSRVGSLKGL